jgi:NADPH:quinone reductase
MRAIVIKQFGGPEVLALEQRPDPIPDAGQVLIEVMALGLNHAEAYLRSGAWGQAAEITGIECVGRVRSDPGHQFRRGRRWRPSSAAWVAIGTAAMPSSLSSPHELQWD